ncbi:hypothetical protein Dimus_027090, partial [Dionaea muscipula]
MVTNDDGKDDAEEDKDGGNDGNHPTAPKNDTPSMNVTEVIKDDDDDVVDSGSHAFDCAQGDDEQHDGRNDDVREEPTEEDEDNLVLSSRIKALRRDNTDDDDIPLSLKYQTTPQSQDTDKDMEVVDITPRVLEMDNKSAIFMGTDGVIYGIDDIDAL